MQITPEAGDIAPSFILPGTDGYLHALADLQGKTALVVFLRHLR
ncbi:MAG: hypothetical protein ACE5JL_19990 [Dehalococcoidia bacterium]